MRIGDTEVYVPFGGTLTVTTRTYYDPENQVPSYVLRQLEFTQKKLSCAEKDNEQLAKELEQVKKDFAKAQQYAEDLRKKNIELQTLLSSAANKLAKPHECKHD